MKKKKPAPIAASPLADLGMYSKITMAIRNAVRTLLENPMKSSATEGFLDEKNTLFFEARAARKIPTGLVTVEITFDPLKLLKITN